MLCGFAVRRRIPRDPAPVPVDSADKKNRVELTFAAANVQLSPDTDSRKQEK